MSRTFSLTMINKENEPSLTDDNEQLASPPPRKSSASKASTSSRAKPTNKATPATTKAKPAAKSAAAAARKTSRPVSASSKAKAEKSSMEEKVEQDDDDDDDDDVPEEQPLSSSRTSRKRAQPADLEHAEDKPAPSKRVASDKSAPKEEDKVSGTGSTQWQAKFDVLIQEKEALQAQFDELYELRHTNAEKVYHDLKKASDDRDRYARETIDALRKQVTATGGAAQSTSAPAPPADPVETTAGDPKTGQLLTAQEAVNLLVQEREERDATQKLLDVEVANSKALLARSKPGAANSAGVGTTKAEDNSTTQVDAEVSRATRCLYEDLTGIVVRSVDRLGEDNRPVPLSPGDADTHNLRFRALFAADGFFPIEFVMQSYPSDGSNPLGRLRFVPALRPDEREEDARIVQRLKDEGASFLAKPLWFGRDAAPRFLSHFLNSYDREAQADDE